MTEYFKATKKHDLNKIHRLSLQSKSSAFTSRISQKSSGGQNPSNRGQFVLFLSDHSINSMSIREAAVEQVDHQLVQVKENKKGSTHKLFFLLRHNMVLLCP